MVLGRGRVDMNWFVRLSLALAWPRAILTD